MIKAPVPWKGQNFTGAGKEGPWPIHQRERRDPALRYGNSFKLVLVLV